MNKKFKILSVFIPIVAAVLSLIYFTRFGDKNITIYLQVSFCSLIPLILYFFERIFKLSVSYKVNMTVAFQIVFSSALGSGVMLYSTTSWWDNFTHLLFGFTASVLFAEFFKESSLLLRFLSVMGCAALWEIFEYVCDNLLNGDAQRVVSALQNGLNPISDTMTDIWITGVGIGVFVVISFLTKRYKFLN